MKLIINKGKGFRFFGKPKNPPGLSEIPPIKGRGRRRQDRRVEYFIMSSIVFHLILLFIFSLITIDLTQAKKEPLVIEFNDKEKYEFNDFPQDKETDEEVDTHRLSDKNRKFEEESVKKGSPLGGGTPKTPSKPITPSPPVNPTPPKPKAEKEPKTDVVSPKKEIAKKTGKPKKTEEDTEKKYSNDRLTATDLFPDDNTIARLNKPPGTTSPGIKEEEDVSLNTREFKYYGYFHHIKTQIEMAWDYPLEAQKNQWGGLLSVIFTVEKDGRVSRVILISSSGHEVLDDAAIDAINFASPFNPIPESIGVERLNITASFEYINSIFGVR
ncbi:MAG: energy transducer TonB [Deltaproteobacteria bacterium]|uniref:Energy transducer TonB n=1 Tax=Candidatus Zymogenus saltonus TaxID=2844893 RepID=A0A9D8KFX3_9DELT|nr:energy transducer TonB [Candidatus Zymogenus saltonus]